MDSGGKFKNSEETSLNEKDGTMKNEEISEIKKETQRPISGILKDCLSRQCTSSNIRKGFVSSLPIITTIRHYKIKEYSFPDFLSGITTACLHLPQGLAFGILASLAPSYGLYTSFFPVIVYVLFGTSPHISIGTNAVIALLTAELVGEVEVPFSAEVTPVSHNKTQEAFNGTASTNGTVVFDAVAFRAEVAAGASCIVGVTLLLMGICRLGIITSYMSTSFVSAFTTVAACHILSSQVPKALGLSIQSVSGAGKLIKLYIEIFKNIAEVNVGSFITSLICLIILVIVKDVINEKCKAKLKIPIPIDLILVIMATLISHFGRLSEQYNIEVVGTIPNGLPSPSLPRMRTSVIGNSIVIAIVIFVLNIAMVRICEQKHNYSADDNQELIAYGMSNFVGSFFLCFPACTAPPRTMLQSTIGAKTTMNGIPSAVVILFILLFIGKYFTSLPVSVLSIMVIVAVKNLLSQVRQLKSLWTINKYDFVIWLGTALSGILIDFVYALYFGIFLCLFTVVVQSQLSKHLVTKSESGQKDFDDMKFEPIKIYKMEASLYFATADIFKKRFYKEVSNLTRGKSLSSSGTTNPDYELKVVSVENVAKEQVETEALDRELPDRFIIFDCSCLNYIDLNGMDALMKVIDDMKGQGIGCRFANCTSYMINLIEKSQLGQRIKSTDIYASLYDACKQPHIQFCSEL